MVDNVAFYRRLPVYEFIVAGVALTINAESGFAGRNRSENGEMKPLAKPTGQTARCDQRLALRTRLKEDKRPEDTILKL